MAEIGSRKREPDTPSTQESVYMKSENTEIIDNNIR